MCSELRGWDTAGSVLRVGEVRDAPRGRGCREGARGEWPMLSTHNQTISEAYLFVSFSKTLGQGEVGVLNA